MSHLPGMSDFERDRLGLPKLQQVGFPSPFPPAAKGVNRLPLEPTQIYDDGLHYAALNYRTAGTLEGAEAAWGELCAVVDRQMQAYAAAAVAAEREANAKLCEAFADENPSDPELVFAGQTMSEAIRARSAV